MMDDIGVYRGINRLYEKMIRDKIMTLDDARKYRNQLINQKINAESLAIETADKILKNMKNLCLINTDA